MSDFSFEGFEPANTTPVPDVLFDVLLPHLNEAQLKVMLYIIRRTLGFKKTSDAISLKQFRWGITTRQGEKLDGGCGLRNFTTITKALKSLEAMHCIESDKRDTSDGDKDTTVYRIRFRGATDCIVPATSSVSGVLRQMYDRPTVGVGRVLRQTEPQETEKQETVIQESVCGGDSLPSEDTHTPSSQNTTELSFSVVTPVESVASVPPRQPTPSTTAVGSIGLSLTAQEAPASLVQQTDVTQAKQSGRGLPPDHNRVGSPPADDKSQTNKQQSSLSKQEVALRRKWAKYVNEDVSRETVLAALALRERWLESYGPYGDAEWDNQALLWIAGQGNGSWENVVKVYGMWEDKEPSKPIHPEMVKNKWFWLSERARNRSSPATLPSGGGSNEHKRVVSPTASASSSVSPEISQRNLERLKAKVAARQAEVAAKGV